MMSPSASPPANLAAAHTALPLLGWTSPQTPFIWQHDGALTTGEFLQQAQQLSAVLPSAQYAINLCESPFHFLLSFAAVLLRGQTNLLPPSRLPQALSDIQQRYANHYVLDDALLAQWPQRDGTAWVDTNAMQTWSSPLIAGEHIAAVLFTSGSTGQSQPYEKPWRTLVAGAAANARAHGLHELAIKPVAVGTVPSQHSYGLETLAMLPLQGYCGLYAQRPFYPHDIAQALQHLPGERILVSTPVHLRALAEAQITLPSVKAIWSATAPLSNTLATHIETQLHTTLHEIFGCTETGTCATRQTAHTAIWQLMPEFSLQTSNNEPGAFVNAAHLPQGAWLQDQFRLLDATHFELLGRGADLINIAGKRASLADLNQRLLSIAGVVDGVMFLPDAPADASPEAVQRTAALVVAPTLTRAQLLSALRERIDPAFLPRPLWLVDALPRNDVGKLPRAALLATLQELTDARR